MNCTASRLLKKLCGMAVVLALMAGIIAVPALAASNGVYLATATPHYRHPETGVIEDSGGESSEVLGQSMTESCLDPGALVEVDEDGNIYVTIRLKLMDNISNPEFEADGEAVEASVTQEDAVNNTADYRMQVPSIGSVIRCGMYVIPMGRDVVFYITISGLEAVKAADAGDFIVNIDVDPELLGDPGEDAALEAAATAAPAEASEAPAESESTTDSGVTGLQEFDAEGNLISSAAPESESESAEQSGLSATTIGCIVAAIVLVAALAACVVLLRKKK